MKQAKWIFFTVLILFLILSYGYFFLCNNGESMVDQQIVVDTWTKPLLASGYKPAIIQKPAGIPGDKQPPAGEPVLWASGTIQDSVTVEILAVETIDGKKWLTGWVGDEKVRFQQVEWSPDEVAICDNNWSVLIAEEWISGADTGVGLAYEPWTVAGARVGLQAVVDVNPDLTDAPDWISTGARISR